MRMFMLVICRGIHQIGLQELPEETISIYVIQILLLHLLKVCRFSDMNLCMWGNIEMV